MKMSVVAGVVAFTLLWAGGARADLSLDAVYPTIGRVEVPLPVNLKGSGFAADTRVSLRLETGDTERRVGAAPTDGYARGVAASGSLVFVADGEGGLLVFDSSDPFTPLQIGGVDTPGFAYQAAIAGDLCLVADGAGGLQVVDVSDPASPAIRAAVEGEGYVYGVAAVSGLAFLVDDYGLQIIDLADPGAPQFVGGVDTPGYPNGVAVSGSRAYVIDDVGLQVVDIQDPSAPEIIGSAEIPGFAYGVTISDDMAYVAAEAGLFIVDVAEPAGPRVISEIFTSGFAYSVAVADGLAYVVDDYGLEVVDLSDPLFPEIIETINTQGLAESVAVAGPVAAVANGDAGLGLFSRPLAVAASVPDSNDSLTVTLPGQGVAGEYGITVQDGDERAAIAGAVTFLNEESYGAIRGQRAIVVIGGTPDGAGSFWDAAVAAAGIAYDALLRQGFARDQIQILSMDADLDLDGDMAADVAAPATNASLQEALTQWASNAGGVLLFLVGPGGEGTFTMNGTGASRELLTPGLLSGWLDTLQGAMAGEVVVVMDACRSGGFAPLTAGEGTMRRTLIAGAGAEESAWFADRGALSFSAVFWSALSRNASVGAAFSIAAGVMASYQTPLLDTDGNGLQEAGDLAVANGMRVGRGQVAAGEAPVIGGVSGDQTLEGNNTTASIEAYGVTGSAPLRSVRAIVIPPAVAPMPPDTPVTDLPVVTLAETGRAGTYQGEYDRFVAEGIWSVDLYAVDAEGRYAVPVRTRVTRQTDTMPAPPEIGAVVGDTVWINAEILTESNGRIQAGWIRGGDSRTARGDRVIWGYFYADPADVDWGSPENPDLFVKVWMDVAGPIYVDYIHLSVPDIDLYTDFAYDGTPAADQTDTASLTNRFVEHALVDGQVFATVQMEDGFPASGYDPADLPAGYLLPEELRIGAVINTLNRGPLEAVWQSGGEGTTARGDRVTWGYFYADPADVPWGSPGNPDLFVKVWYDVSGAVFAAFFHVSVPDIAVYSELPRDGIYDNQGMLILSNRFVEHRYRAR